MEIVEIKGEWWEEKWIICCYKFIRKELLRIKTSVLHDSNKDLVNLNFDKSSAKIINWENL